MQPKIHCNYWKYLIFRFSEVVIICTRKFSQAKSIQSNSRLNLPQGFPPNEAISFYILAEIRNRLLVLPSIDNIVLQESDMVKSEIESWLSTSPFLLHLAKLFIKMLLYFITINLPFILFFFNCYFFCFFFFWKRNHSFQF